MKRRRHPKTTDPRRGIILLVVLALLTLFLVVGLSFVIYADSELDASNNSRDAGTAYQPDMDPEQAFAYAMSQLLYDTNDDETGVWSSFRGGSLARSLYGYNTGPFPAIPSLNITPFNGTGRLHNTLTAPAAFTGIDDYMLVNYMYFPSDGFLRDPERFGMRSGVRDPVTGAPIPLTPFTGGFNAPYTYPDLNNLFLAAVDSGGNVLARSFFREIPVASGGFGPLDPANPNWLDTTKPYLKYMVLRPRPADNPSIGGKPGFPLPEDVGGDVKNLIGGPGGNDSIWIDIGAPVMKLPDGRKYKMLVAPLIMDVDGRVNLNVHGNIMGQNGAHASDQGWGKWEINLSKVLAADPNKTEWQNLFIGNGNNKVSGRYGTNNVPDGVLNGMPNDPLSVPPGRRSPFYSQTDLNACLDAAPKTPSNPLLVPLYNNPPSPASPPLSLFPTLLAAGGYSDGLNNELVNHASRYNFFLPGNDDRAFGWSHMEALLRYGDTNSPAFTSDLYRLLPLNMSNAQVRRLVTTHSFDLDRAGITPYVFDRNPNNLYPAPDPTNTRYALQLPPSIIPQGGPIAFPSPRTATSNAPAEFDATTWRAISAALNRVDLNRIDTFVQYPPPDNTGRINLAGAPLAPYNAAPYNAAPYSFVTQQDQFNYAQAQRTQIAGEIYNRLVAVTGVLDPAQTAPTTAAAPESPEFQAARWLAQLAVNIVDYIDYDDISTPFNWFTFPATATDPALANKPMLVFGTELPRVVMNEAYAEINNDLTERTLAAGAKAAKDYRVSFWVELLNPFSNTSPVYGPTAGVPADNGVGRLQVAAAGASQAYAVYQLAITDTNPSIRLPFNILGDPDNSTANPSPIVHCIASDLSPDVGFTPVAGVDYTVILPNGNFYGDPVANNGKNNGFYLLGPIDPFPGAVENGVPVPLATLAVKDQPLTKGTGTGYGATVVKDTTLNTFRSSMVYNVPVATLAAQFPKVNSLLLRRLACPGLPPQLDWTKPLYNPYVTVDYLDTVPVNAAVNNDSTGANVSVNIALRKAVGKREPYAAKQVVPSTLSKPFTLQPQHTFFRHNGVEDAATVAANSNNPSQAANQAATPPQLQIPFHWLTHLDRQVTSPGELLEVSGFKPSELTQQFVAGGPPAGPYQHLAPWFDQQARIYRVLELLEARDRANGCSIWGRHPGKININTIWDPLVWQALCDAQQPTNNFTVAQVQQIYIDMLTQRTPTGAPGPNDCPFRGMGPGASPAGDPQYPVINGINGPIQPGIQQTLFAAKPLPPLDPSHRMFGVPITSDPVTDPNGYANQAHPYQQNALLTKIFSNVTTRSNVFAVYMTVGFFEVNDDTSRPVKLGAELGRAENRHVRHRMFALVDRTSMTWFSYNTPPSPNPLVTIPPGQTSVQALISIPPPVPPATQPVDPRTGKPFVIVPGMILNIDFGGKSVDQNTGQLVYAEENVVVLPSQPTDPPNTFRATFTKQHNNPPNANGITIRCFGNPGPWTRYDPRQDNQVVPYFSIID